MAAGGVPLPYFERYPGLVPLLSERAQYVREWIRIFYATLFVGNERAYIQFMFNETQWRLNRGDIARLLGVTIPDEPSSLHFMSYGYAEPPRHAHDMDFPSDEDVSILFQQPFLLGTPRTLDRLTPVAYTINLALRRSLLYRQGYN